MCLQVCKCVCKFANKLWISIFSFVRIVLLESMLRYSLLLMGESLSRPLQNCLFWGGFLYCKKLSLTSSEKHFAFGKTTLGLNLAHGWIGLLKRKCVSQFVIHFTCCCKHFSSEKLTNFLWGVPLTPARTPLFICKPVPDILDFLCSKLLSWT